MPGREVILEEAEAALADRLVRAGRFRTLGDVVSAGIRLLDKSDQEERARHLAWLDAMVAEGEADIAAGRSTVLDSPEDVRAFMTGIARESG